MIDLLNLFSLACLPAFIAVDFVIGRRRQPGVRGWRLRAVLLSSAMFLFVMQVGEGWGLLLGQAHLLDGYRLGAAGGAIVGILTYELVHYWYHRAVHRWGWLWRFVGHQLHHSAERIDAFGAFYGHPLDFALFTTWSVLVFYGLLGLSPEAAAIGGAFLAFNGVFQHANIATPRWLGYLIQRPESHRVHHARGVHHYNYSDLPILDMLFGTFRNPRDVSELKHGFYDGASARIGEMLIGRDVSRPKTGHAAPGLVPERAV